jgi:peptidoglycan/xylan/chitin deacetylase (PgdA/CDA1 family)
MIRNFLFHRVDNTFDPLWDPMRLALFDKCISYIKANYDVVLFEDLCGANYNLQNHRFATIMFDDGYKDNILNAAPILKHHGCKASFYIVTDCIDTNTPTWTHQLEHVFQNTAITDLKINFPFLPQHLHVNGLFNYNERIAYVKRLKPFLKRVKHHERAEVLNYIFKTYHDTTFPKLMMNWDDLISLKSNGHYIGSHTKSHAMLGTMQNAFEIETELSDSAQSIKQHLGYMPLTISYPVGSYNAQVKALAKKAGYTYGLAVHQNIFNPNTHDWFEVPRIELYNETWFKTKLRITHRLEQIKTILRYK